MARLAAGVRKRKDGTLEKRFTMNGVRYSVYGATTKEILEKEQERRNQISKGLYTENRNLTLEKYFAEWIERKKTTTKENTLLTYKSFYQKHLNPTLGNRKIISIERREVQKLQSDLLEVLNPNTINIVFKVLRAVLNDAVKDRIITENVASGIKTVKADQEKATDTKHRALTPEEQAAFMNALQGNYYYNFIALMLYTGIRSGEASALLWSDIDYKNNVIHISKTLTRDSKRKYVIGNTPKTESGNRIIPLNDDIEKVLEQQKAINKILPFPTTNIFATINDKLVTAQQVNKAISDTLKALDQDGHHIEPFTSHALRDTFATRYIEQGGNMNTLKVLLGHSSITMTMDLYAHVLPDTKAEEMNRIRIAL